MLLDGLGQLLVIGQQAEVHLAGLNTSKGHLIGIWSFFNTTFIYFIFFLNYLEFDISLVRFWIWYSAVRILWSLQILRIFSDRCHFSDLLITSFLQVYRSSLLFHYPSSDLLIIFRLIFWSFFRLFRSHWSLFDLSDHYFSAFLITLITTFSGFCSVLPLLSMFWSVWSLFFWSVLITSPLPHLSASFHPFPFLLLLLYALQRLEQAQLELVIIAQRRQLAQQRGPGIVLLGIFENFKGKKNDFQAFQFRALWFL